MMIPELLATAESSHFWFRFRAQITSLPPEVYAVKV